jgi:hypothetical protein
VAVKAQSALLAANMLPRQHAHNLVPRAVEMPRSFSPAAMARKEVAPAVCNSAIVGARSATRASARFVTTSEAALRMALVIVVPRYPPSLTPRRFAAANAAFVRSEIILA